MNASDNTATTALIAEETANGAAPAVAAEIGSGTEAGRRDRQSPGMQRMTALDGWRGVSILTVLCCHLLPLGPKAWELNPAAAPLGMSLFFTLSGFLITSTLLEHLSVRSFFIRRACRILPLAFLYIAVVLLLQAVSWHYYPSHFLFFINYDHHHITKLTGHLWSVSVEGQFYLFIGLLAALAGARGFLLLPLLCLGITALRIVTGTPLSIVTHFRVDEILVGACLALVHYGHIGLGLKRAISRVWQPLLIILLLLSCHRATGPMNYLRPYCAAALVGSTLWKKENRLYTVLASGVLRYVANISYALYIIHPLTAYGWLGTGGTWERYLLKRPISFALTFGLAHLSTFYYEQRWIAWGKRLARRRHQ